MAAALLATMALAVEQHASAQTAPQSPEAAALEGLRREEERSRQQLQQLQPRSDVLTPAAAKPTDSALPVESPCFTLQEIRLEGAGWERFSWLASAGLPYLRQCVGVQGLGRIAATLDGKLLERGYATTRVSLPAQNLQTGVLRVEVHVGHVAGIQMVEASGPESRQSDERWGTWRNAFPISAGEVLNIRDLEQGVEQMKRLPSQSVTTRLEPGEQPGSSIVFIERKAGTLRDRLRGGVTLDNSGGQALGRPQLSANVALDNPAGLNDVLTASLNTNAQQPTSTHRSQSLSLNYSVPWGYSLVSVGVSRSRFAQYVQGTTVRFLSSGTSESADARLSHTLWRSASSKLGIYGALAIRRAFSFLDDTEVVIQRRRTTSAEAGVSYKHLFASSSIEVELGHRRGVPWLGAQEDFITAQDGGLTLRPRIWSFNGSYGTDFALAGRTFQYTASLRGQRTRDTTLSLDQISIGGRSSVRGFDGDAVLLAENGLVLRNELTTPVKLWEGLDASALLALDYGRVWGPSDILLTGKKLAGLALGLRGRMGANQFDATLATPLHKPDGFQTRRLNLYLTLTRAF